LTVSIRPLHWGLKIEGGNPFDDRKAFDRNLLCSPSHDAANATMMSVSLPEIPVILAA
jgi:hypothetical protein